MSSPVNSLSLSSTEKSPMNRIHLYVRIVTAAFILTAMPSFAQFCTVGYTPPPERVNGPPGCTGPGGNGGPGGPAGGTDNGKGIFGGPVSAGASPSGTSSGPAESPCNSCTGSPCYVATGNYISYARDLDIATPGFPLSVARKYESG